MRAENLRARVVPMSRKPSEMLKRWRLQGGLSQEAAGKAFKCNKSTVCRLEKGYGGPTAITAYHIAQATKGAIPVMAWFKGVK